MRAVVTGGTGFVGGHLVDLLLEKKYDIVNISRGITQNSLDKKITHVTADINSPDTLVDIIKKDDVVFHVAALLGSAAASEEEYNRVNIDGTINVLNRAIESGAKTFIYVSTFAGMGPVGSLDKPMTELTPCKPDNIYGASKYKAEERIKEISSGKITVIVLRPNIIFGPGFNPATAAAKLFSNMQKKNFIIIGNTENYFPMCYVKNLTHAMVHFAEHHNSGFHTYLVADGEPVKFKETLKMIKDEFGINKRIIHIPYFLPITVAHLMVFFGKVFHFNPLVAPYIIKAIAKNGFYYDMSKTIREGFNPPFTLQTAIKETAKSFIS
jgi:nucleoside-diphosphate-sugar epimerase